jgi:hypothetical protein
MHTNRYMSYRLCWLLASNIRNLIPVASNQHNLYDIHLLVFIHYYTPDDRQKTCPKHVEFCSKNKFEKLVHLIVFIIRIELVEGVVLDSYESFPLCYIQNVMFKAKVIRYRSNL